MPTAGGGPTPLVELRRLGHTLMQLTADILTAFDRPATGTDPPRQDIETQSEETLRDQGALKHLTAQHEQLSGRVEIIVSKLARMMQPS